MQETPLIASYVDKAFIVQSLDDNFNVRRVERFMVQVLEENIKPVLVLNKSDLDFDRQSVEEQINHISNQIPVFYQSDCFFMLSVTHDPIGTVPRKPHERLQRNTQ